MKATHFAALMLGLLANAAMAQGVYRIVGPDGRVTFSDQPPPAAAKSTAVGATPASSAGAVAGAQLPYELRQVAARYPVTLYTSDSCAPCNSARNLLNARGIPYSEKTVSTKDDADALRRLSGGTSLPILTIGSQQLKGYADSEWIQFLDAAGYPKQSRLPAAYRRPTATPLVAVAPADAAATAATPGTHTPRANRPADEPATNESDEAPVTPPVNNPAGIRF